MLAPLMLSGCLWGPGKFTSNLALNKSGTFVLDYKDEVVLQMPDDKGTPPDPWSDKMLKCFKDGRVETTTMLSDDSEEADEDSRPCTAAEIARARSDYEKQAADNAAKKRQENEQMAKLFGLPGSDDTSNRRFAANLMKYQGWRSVSHRGKGVFDVDYHVEGRLTRDYAFR
jgi:hypothetical protein